MSKCGITIFTPTYNRAYILEQAYKSLLNQTCKNFEWVIVDDGSNDNTRKLVQSWIKKAEITIRYFYQKNSGKPAAHNLGVQKAQFELFLCLDSDDYLTNDAVEKILETYTKIKNDENITGIIAFRELTNVNKHIEIPLVDFTTLEDLNYKYKYNYDLALAYKTKLLKKYPFPIIPGEKFIQENYVYDQIDLLGKMAVIPCNLYICEYLEDGYSKNIKSIIEKNPHGYILCARQKFMLSKNIKSKLHGGIRLIIGCLLLKDLSYINKMKGLKNKIFLYLLLPIGDIIYLKKYRFRKGEI